MIVARAPLRFSLGGGGTDLPAYSRRFGGFLVASAIDKYVYVAANRRYSPDLRLSYSKTEIARDVREIEHPIFREALLATGVRDSIELVSVADLPAQSGLGSSGTFTVALFAALDAFRGDARSPRELAEAAADLEMRVLGEPVGAQDPFVAAHGGFVALTFARTGHVEVEPLQVSAATQTALERALLVFDSGALRPAKMVLAEQGQRLAADEADAVSGMHRVKEIGHEVRDLLVSGDLDRYGALLDEHWTRKRRFASTMTDGAIDAAYAAAREAGALGGKLIGAGGGGFFMFYVPEASQPDVAQVLSARGLRRLPFRFEASGVVVSKDLFGAHALAPIDALADDADP